MTDEAKPESLAIEEVPLEKLSIAPYNPRKISPEAMAKLEKSLVTFGCVDPLIVNKRTGYRVIGGHQRLAVLRKHNRPTAPCVILDIEEDREKMLNIALNNQNLAGEYDFSQLADLLLEFDTKGLDVSVIGFDDKEMAKIMNWTPDPETAKEGGGMTTCPKCGHTW
jgi:ParB-like chromosome segregation protein Spo0J